MSNKVTGVEESAASVLKRAVALDNEQRYSDALICYQEGMGLLLQASKSVSDTKKQHYIKSVSQYMERAEKLKELVKHEESLKSNAVTQINIKDNDTGYSYEKIFGKYLTVSVTEVIVEDPYIRAHHQIQNFLKFCEVLIKSDAQVRCIKLKTSFDQNSRDDQLRKLNQIKENLKNFNIELEIDFSDTLHDREIKLNNGWKIKIGRGLDFYKRIDKMGVGTFDYDFRKCFETTVDIYHT